MKGRRVDIPDPEKGKRGGLEGVKTKRGGLSAGGKGGKGRVKDKGNQKETKINKTRMTPGKGGDKESLMNTKLLR